MITICKPPFGACSFFSCRWRAFSRAMCCLLIGCQGITVVLKRANKRWTEKKGRSEKNVSVIGGASSAERVCFLLLVGRRYFWRRVSRLVTGRKTQERSRGLRGLMSIGGRIPELGGKLEAEGERILLPTRESSLEYFSWA